MSPKKSGYKNHGGLRREMLIYLAKREIRRVTFRGCQLLTVNSLEMEDLSFEFRPLDFNVVYILVY